MAKWNCRTLLSACETLLKRPDCTLTLRTLREEGVTAQNSYNWANGQPSNIHLTVDPAQASLVEGFLHEALHIVLGNELGEHFNSVLEEAQVKAIEHHLWTKTMRRGDLARWRRLINAKLR